MGLFYDRAASGLPNPKFGKILLWCLLVVGLLGGAFVLRTWWPEGSNALLLSFSVVFPAILVLLGIETARVATGGS